MPRLTLPLLTQSLNVWESNGANLKNYCVTLDTLSLARQLHPGQKNSLDALCQRYEVDNSKRELHGALLDAQILLDVYLAMTGGQTSLSLEEETDAESDTVNTPVRLTAERASLKLIQPSDDELEAHHKILTLIEQVSGAESIWNKTGQ